MRKLLFEMDFNRKFVFFFPSYFKKVLVLIGAWQIFLGETGGGKHLFCFPKG